MGIMTLVNDRNHAPESDDYVIVQRVPMRDIYLVNCFDGGTRVVDAERRLPNGAFQAPFCLECKRHDCEHTLAVAVWRIRGPKARNPIRVKRSPTEEALGITPGRLL